MARFARQFRDAEVCEGWRVVFVGGFLFIVMSDEGAFGVHPVRDAVGVVVVGQILDDRLCLFGLDVELISRAKVVQ